MKTVIHIKDNVKTGRNRYILETIDMKKNVNVCDSQY